MKRIERILVVRTDRIGDVILTLPMLEVLRKNFPTAHIAVLVRKYTGELLEGNPNVDGVLIYDNGRAPLPFFHMAAALRKQHFDIVFITYPRFRLAWLTFWAGIPLRVGTGYRWYSFLFNRRIYVHRKVAAKHEAEYNIELLKAIGCDVSRPPFPRLAVSHQARESIRTRLQHFGISTEKPLVIVHPGSGRSARDWSLRNFGALGRKLRLLPDVQVVVTGGSGEERLIRSVADMIGADTPVVNLLSLQEYAALASRCALLVANSTGPLHIAAAVGTPVIGLYPQVTAMSATRWAPYTDRKTIFTPKGKPDNCYACVRNGTECDCMNSIAVDDVFEAAKQYLAAEKVHA
jgi:heptosyltransferase-3